MNWKHFSLWKLNCWCSHISGEFISLLLYISFDWRHSFPFMLGVFFLRLRSLRLSIAIAWFLVSSVNWLVAACVNIFFLCFCFMSLFLNHHFIRKFIVTTFWCDCTTHVLQISIEWTHIVWGNTLCDEEIHIIFMNKIQCSWRNQADQRFQWGQADQCFNGDYFNAFSSPIFLETTTTKEDKKQNINNEQYKAINSE